MSLLDDVSIVVTPNGYKAGELYAVVPVPTEGAEEVTNGDFATDSDWSKAPSVTISGGSANFNLASDTYVYQDILTATKTYKITFSGTINSGSLYIEKMGLQLIYIHQVHIQMKLLILQYQVVQDLL